MKPHEFLHPPAIVAGFVAVFVGFASSAVVVFQAANSAGANAEQVGSWMVALGLGMGLTTIGLSLYYRQPILTAWSTPGAALLVVSLAGVPMSDAIGAFLFSAVLITLCGVTGWFEKIMDRIPLALAAAMLAGVLFQFGVSAFASLESRFELVALMLAVYLLGKRFAPRYAVVGVLFVGLLFCWWGDLLTIDTVELTLALPVWVAPTFSLDVMIGVGIPLFVVTMVSQNMPGIAALRASGYNTPISPLISWTGIGTLLLAPFGGFAFNLAAITAAICAGPEAHHDPNRRYLATLSAGVFYLVMAAFGFALADLFSAFPKEFIFALAGLALLSTIANSLNAALSEASTREAAIITFIVTASGVTLFGIGAAFWGLLCGVMASLILKH